MERDWIVEHRRGGAQELHDRAAEPLPDAGRRIVVHEVTAPALVLGSTQADGVVDHDAAGRAGVEVARRRSGGGAVLLEPGAQVWVDVVVPAGDPLWDDDVERATWWLGRAWADALPARLPGGAGSGGPATVHLFGVTDRDLGRVACFAGLGPGEVAVGGRKLVGVSQRRTRDAARFQCVAYRRWEPDRLLGLLRRAEGRDRLDAALRERAGAAVGAGWSVVEDLLPQLG